MEFKELVLTSMLLGFMAALAWILLLILAVGVASAWNWVDDDENPVKYNPLITGVGRVLGLTRQYDGYFHNAAGEAATDPETIAGMGFFILLLGPVAAVLLFKLWPLTLVCLLAVVVAWVARLARRTSKIIHKHLKDPNAHK